MVYDRDVAIVMRDGIKLYADIFRPNSNEKFGALLPYSPYVSDIDHGSFRQLTSLTRARPEQVLTSTRRQLLLIAVTLGGAPSCRQPDFFPPRRPKVTPVRLCQGRSILFKA